MVGVYFFPQAGSHCSVTPQRLPSRHERQASDAVAQNGPMKGEPSGLGKTAALGARLECEEITPSTGE